jgi:hypothetical protein
MSSEQFACVAIKIGLVSTNDLTVLQLLARERSLRIMVSNALTPEEAKALLALAEDYASLATQRQIH